MWISFILKTNQSIAHIFELFPNFELFFLKFYIQSCLLLLVLPKFRLYLVVKDFILFA